VYGGNVWATLSIRYWLHQIKLWRTDLQRQYVGGRPPLDNISTECSSILPKLPLSSVRTPADSVGISASTIYFFFVEKIGLDNILLCWIPRILTDELRHGLIELAG
jgi:hypothetical protein